MSRLWYTSVNTSNAVIFCTFCTFANFVATFAGSGSYQKRCLMAWKCLLPWLHTSWLRYMTIHFSNSMILESSSVLPALRNHILEGTNNVDTESEDGSPSSGTFSPIPMMPTDKPASVPFPIACTARFWLHLVPGLVIPSWPSWPNYFVS
ncbi:hypothetical protein B0H13DRAFT_2313726 [Mycena leptocephala]|nr:hypothetical protein B0H13DRAFT_2313726 [Mycena leptocephala]